MQYLSWNCEKCGIFDDFSSFLTLFPHILLYIWSLGALSSTKPTFLDYPRNFWTFYTHEDPGGVGAVLYINWSLSTGARWKKLGTFNRCTPKPLLWAYCEPNVKQLCVLKKNCTNRSSTAHAMLHGIVPNCSSKENELFFKCFWIVALEKLLGNKRMRDL